MANLSSLYLLKRRCYFVLDTFHGWPLSKYELFQSLKKTLPVTLNTNLPESKPAVWSLDSGHHQQVPHFCGFDRFFCFTCIKALRERQTYSTGSVPLPSASLSCLHGLVEEWTLLSQTLLSRSLLSFRGHNNSSFSLGSLKVLFFTLQLLSLLFSALSWVEHSFLEEQCPELDTVVHLRPWQLWEEEKDYPLWFVGCGLVERVLHIVRAREDKYCILNVTES